jgi:drug/metabolite transporter (DMT)-like permease
MNHSRTHFLLLTTVICWGFNATILKTLISTIDIKTILLLRVFLATIFLIGIHFFLIKKPLISITPHVLIYSALGGFFYLYSQLELHLHGLMRTTATNAVLITACVPTMSIIFEHFIFKKKFSQFNILGTLLSMMGVALVILNRDQFTSTSWIGNFLILLSVISACIGGSMIQKLSQNSHLSTSTLVHIFGSIIYLGDSILGSKNVWQSINTITLNAWVLILFFALVNGAIATILWTRGISELGLAQTSAYLPLVPFVGIITNSIILGEQLTIYHLLGLICVITGTVFATRENMVLTNKKLIQND